MTVASDSMWPLLRSGDSIIVEQCAAYRVRCGDVIVFTSNGEFCTHRCLRVFTWGNSIKYLTKGDAARSADAIVESADLVGKVMVIERGERRLVVPRSVDHIIGKIAYGVWLSYEYLRRMKRAVLNAWGQAPTHTNYPNCSNF
jgi:signal peptidase I